MLKNVIAMKTALDNMQKAKPKNQVLVDLTASGAKPLSKKAAEMKIFLTNNPIPKEFLK